MRFSLESKRWKPAWVQANPDPFHFSPKHAGPPFHSDEEVAFCIFPAQPRRTAVTRGFCSRTGGCFTKKYWACGHCRKSLIAESFKKFG